jgi:Protein of unknown function (DUF3995)
MTLIALLMGGFLAAAAAFHFYWGFGGQYGRHVAVPQREDGTSLFVPTTTATLAVALALALMLVALAVYEMRLDLFLPRSLMRLGMSFLAVIFLIRGLSWHRYVGLFRPSELPTSRAMTLSFTVLAASPPGSAFFCLRGKAEATAYSLQ